MNIEHRRIALLIPFLMASASCSHTLEITNLQDYSIPFALREPERKIDLVIGHGSVAPDAIWLLNAVTKGISTRREIGKISSEFRSDVGFEPDCTVSITPSVEYQSSGWNFLVNFPGGLIFAPAWHGYAYDAKISTAATIYDGSGNTLREVEIRTPYTIRHSEFDRTWYPLFSFNILNPVGGVYTALVYDSDVTLPFQNAVVDNYAEYVTDRLLQELRELGFGTAPAVATTSRFGP